jgi:hypothetical protein
MDQSVKARKVAPKPNIIVNGDGIPLVPNRIQWLATLKRHVDILM